MIESVKVTNYLGESITFELANPWKTGIAITEIEGLGPGKATISTSKMATRDGSKYNSSRVEERNIVIHVRYLWNPTIEDSRQLTYKYFPLKQNLTLEFKTGNRFVTIEGRVESNEPDIFQSETEGEISIICPFPYFQSSENGGMQTTIFSGIEPMFEFPFSNESLTEPLLETGRIRNYTENTVLYEGDVETGVTIRIHALGDVGSITIYNLRTRESMRIDANKIAEYVGGEGIIASDDIVICTEQGGKSVTLLRAGTTYNILNCVDQDVDWFQLSKGDNLFTYVCEFGATNLQFRIENKVLYGGI